MPTNQNNDMIKKTIKLLTPATLEQETPEIPVDIKEVLKTLGASENQATKTLDFLDKLVRALSSMLSGQQICEDENNINLASLISGSITDLRNALKDLLKELTTSHGNCNNTQKDNFTGDLADRVLSNQLINEVAKECCSSVGEGDRTAFTHCVALGLLKRVPQIAGGLRGNRYGGCRLDSRRVWLLDTCYDTGRVKDLIEGLRRIRSSIGGGSGLCDGNDFKKFLLLTIAAYTASTKKPGDVWKIDWYISLVHAASDKATPLCPSRGDVAALVYLAKLCGSSSGSSNSSSNGPSNSNDNNRIDANTVKQVVERLLVGQGGGAGSS